MIERLIEWSARNPFLVGLATIALTVGGIIAVLRTPLDALPDLSDVQVIIYTEVHRPGAADRRGPGHLSADQGHAGRAEVEGRARLPLFGARFVYIIFDDGTDLYWAR